MRVTTHNSQTLQLTAYFAHFTRDRCARPQRSALPWYLIALRCLRR